MDTENTIGGQLRKTYPKTLALGVGGNGPLSELATIREYASKLKPRRLIWFYFEDNDLMDLGWELKSPLNKYRDEQYNAGLFEARKQIDDILSKHTEEYLNDANQLPKRSSESSLWSSLSFSELIKKGSTFASTRTFFSRAGDRPYTENLSSFKEILAMAKKETEAWGGEFLFVYLPAFGSLAKVSGRDRYNYEKLIDIVKSLNIPIIDMRREFLETPDPLVFFPFRMPNHYNEAGYQFISEKITSAL